jgi:hypothetical protein
MMMMARCFPFSGFFCAAAALSLACVDALRVPVVAGKERKH